jgi:hypothetical protein
VTLNTPLIGAMGSEDLETVGKSAAVRGVDPCGEPGRIGRLAQLLIGFGEVERYWGSDVSKALTRDCEPSVLTR